MLKKKVTFLLEKKNNWIFNYISELKKKLNNDKKYICEITYDYKKIKNQDIVIVLSYTKILPVVFLNQNKLNIVIHSSKLPVDKGFAPLSYQILRNKRKIFNTLFKITEKVDDGPIIMRNTFNTNNTDLYVDLRKKQAESILKLLIIFFKKYPKITFKNQKGKSTFNLKRTKKNSELDIKKSIKEQFNLIRICDNEKFPAFFYYNKKKYIIKIYKERDHKNYNLNYKIRQQIK